MNGPYFAQTGAPPRPAPANPAPTPRAAGIPRPPARMPIAKPSDGDPAAMLRVLTYLRLHWLMILFCGTLLGSVLAYTAWSLIPTKFESYALLRVASSPTAIGATGDPNRGQTAFATYIKTTAQLIKSEFVLNSALNDPKYKITELPTLTAQKDPIKFLDEKIQVTYSDGSEVIRISLEGDRPEDIRKIVDAVKDAYNREVVEKELKAKTDLKLKVETAKAKLEERLKKKTGDKLDLTAIVGKPTPKPGVATPAPVLPGQGEIAPGVAPVAGNPPVPEPEAARRARFPVVLNKIFTLEDQLQHYPLTVGEKKAEVDSLKKQIEYLRNGPASPEALATVEKDQEVLAKEFEAMRAKRDYEYLKKVVLNPESDRVARSKEAAEKIENELKQLKNEKLKQLEGGRRQKDADKLFLALDKAERELRSMQERERVARKLLDDAKKELAELPQESKKEDEKEKGPLVDPQTVDITNLGEIYHRLAAQDELLAYEIESGGRVQKLQDASNPSQKDAKKQILGTVFAGLMGFVLIALGVVGVETKARKVSSLGELKASGPTPVVGVIPWSADGSAARDPIRRADVNEAVDKLRSYVAQTWLSRGATTVAITSPLGDEGKSFAAFGLASSLAQAGYRTLLIDFDLRNPVLHTYAGVANAAGVCELLRGEGDRDIRKTVQSLPSGLQFLPAGKWSDEARQAAVGGRLEALISRLREPYDCVVLHSHSLLTSAESVEVARRSEVVLLCCLYRETRLPLLKRATDRVATMEVPYSGIVYLGSTQQEAIC